MKKSEILAAIKDLNNQITVNNHVHGDAYGENSFLEAEISRLQAELKSASKELSPCCNAGVEFNESVKTFYCNNCMSFLGI